MHKKLLIIFASAFLLNFLCEHLHSFLYVSYRGGEITGAILARAALFDAVVITIFALPFILFSTYRRGYTLFIVVCVIFAVALEKWALGTGRWIYADAMPLVPYLSVGLTPAIQLALTGYVALCTAGRQSS